MKRAVYLLILSLAIASTSHASQKKEKEKQQQASPLDEFIERARQTNPPQQTSASLFSATSPNLFLFRDVKARTVNDIVTIQIIENAAASNSANTASDKKSDINLAAAAFNFDKTLQASSGLSFAGQGTTTRSGQLQAWLTARVSEVLPNGDLVIEGTKDVTVNRERQSLTMRGVIRSRDVSPGNIVLSTAISHMEVKFDGKGIVSDANKPGFLYWLISKITPF